MFSCWSRKANYCERVSGASILHNHGKHHVPPFIQSIRSFSRSLISLHTLFSSFFQNPQNKKIRSNRLLIFWFFCSAYDFGIFFSEFPKIEFFTICWSHFFFFSVIIFFYLSLSFFSSPSVDDMNVQHTFEICTKINDTNPNPLFLISFKIKRKWLKPKNKTINENAYKNLVKNVFNQKITIHWPKNKQTNTNSKWAAIRTRYWPTQEESVSQIEKIQSHIRPSTGNQLFLGTNMLQKKSERFNILVIVFVPFVGFIFI